MLERPRRADRRRAAARERRTTAAERTRRYRERLSRGQKVAPTPYDNNVVELLLDLGWLPLAKSENAKEVGAAIATMLADTVAKRRGGDA